MTFGCASAWYEYGNALLVKEEDAPSDGLLNGPEKAEQDQDQADRQDGLDENEQVGIHLTLQ
jgi:hypothetical protein